jgi:hypothetical protein
MQSGEKILIRIFINKLGVAPHPQTPGPRRKHLPPYLSELKAQDEWLTGR